MAKVKTTEVSFAFKKGLAYNSAEVRLGEAIQLEEGDEARQVRAKSLKRLKTQVMEAIAKVQAEYEKANPGKGK